MLAGQIILTIVVGIFFCITLIVVDEVAAGLSEQRERSPWARIKVLLFFLSCVGLFLTASRWTPEAQEQRTRIAQLELRVSQLEGK